MLSNSHEGNVVGVDLGVVIHGHTIAVGISQFYSLLKAMVGQGIFNLSLRGQEKHEIFLTIEPLTLGACMSLTFTHKPC